METNIINIRPYHENDVYEILNIINYNILNSTALYDYSERSLANQKVIFEEKLSKNFPIFVATENENIVGFGYYSEFRFREAYKFTVEHSVYAHPNHIGKGIGKMILEELISRAKTQNLHTMIGVIDSENQGSIDFHKKFGFEIVGTIRESGFKFDRWLHSIIMQKML
ncbi:MAG: N-acetyltransferase [Flavobacterium sp.]|nr:N-acetyltransferase [Flavobacterium sp.]